MAEITKNMKISDILALNELMAPFLMQNGLSCVTCAASQAESLEEACEVHGINVEDLTEDLNDVLREYMEAQEEAAKSYGWKEGAVKKRPNRKSAQTE